jgi:dolichol kinase
MAPPSLSKECAMASVPVDVPLDAAAPDERHRTANRVFRGALAFNGALTLLWLFYVWVRPSEYFFKEHALDWQQMAGVFIGFTIFNVIWGFIWWGVKGSLLKRFVGFTKEERRLAFESRMDKPFEVADFTSRYSERRIRIADMIGRRGRFGIMALSGFFFFYLNVKDGDPNAFGGPFLRNNLLEAVLSSWLFIAFFYANNVVARAMYGPQSRVMDGVLARANCLLISTLWLAFKFVFVPIGATLGTMYPPHTFAAVFALIWGSYIVCDAAAEIVGSLWGKQQIRVWGLGDVNRKSIAGTVAGFTAALALGLVVVFTQGLPAPWIGLAVAIALSNTLLELYSPRGTDDFTMAVGNALVCLAFGALMY